MTKSAGIKVKVLHFNDGEKEISLNRDISLMSALVNAGYSEIPNNWFVMVNTEDIEEKNFGSTELENGDVITIVGNVAGGGYFVG